MRPWKVFGLRNLARRAKSLLLGTGLVLLSGCAVGPRYSRPATATPPEYKELPPNWKTAQPSDQIAKGKWWEIFEDPQLSALEEQINVSNQTLKAAQAQYEQARAIVRINRSNQFPTVGAGVTATQSRQSVNRPNGRLASANRYTDLQLPVDASYEADVWGRVRRTVEAARANAQASAADRASLPRWTWPRLKRNWKPHALRRPILAFSAPSSSMQLPC